MSAEVVEMIQGLVDAETKGWDEKNIEPFLAMIHPDMAWPFAPNADAQPGGDFREPNHSLLGYLRIAGNHH